MCRRSRNVSFSVEAGEYAGLLTGSGKTTLQHPAALTDQRVVLLEGRDITSISEKSWLSVVSSWGFKARILSADTFNLMDNIILLSLNVRKIMR